MEKIVIRGAREHNLKAIDVEIPRNRLVVFTGVSGSGKSSLAFDTLYAEGQRRYVESLSAYARQFLGQLEKPLYESIEGLSPAIAIEQKSVSHNPRSTVGTVTEIADFLRVLFARAGEPHCPECGRPVGQQSAQQMVDRILELGHGTRLMITAPLIANRKGSHADLIEDIRRKGYVRARINGRVTKLDGNVELDEKRRHDIAIVVDRLVLREGIERRLTDSVETALREASGVLSVLPEGGGEEVLMSEHNACVYCGISMPELSPQLFSFNSPLGMCPQCSGLGFEMRVDPELVVPRPALSIKDGAVSPWGEPRGGRLVVARALAEEFGFNLGAPWKCLGADARDAILHGTGSRRIEMHWRGDQGSGTWEGSFEGVIPRLERLYHTTGSEAMRKQYEKYFRRIRCSGCDGTRLRKESRAVLLGGSGIDLVTSMTVEAAHEFFDGLILDEVRTQIGGELIKEISARLGFLIDVGLHYITLDRSAGTLAGGEAQRIRLASQIGSGLTGVLYVLDEPTIGLHRRDNDRLIGTLERLRDLGNTVLVVEHDRETIERADHVIDFGPGAGVEGGRIVAEGRPDDIRASADSITGRYLSGQEAIHRVRSPRGTGRTKGGSLELRGAALHNLKDVTLKLPLGNFVCVTGVSGSGKSSLITETLYPAVSNALGIRLLDSGPFTAIKGIRQVDKVINISQDPIGRTPRSNPATYTKAFDHIRRLFSELPNARLRGYKPGRFSFNVRGGRCEDCRGAGVKRIEMHFLADVFVECQTCHGRRFNKETLQVRFHDLSIAEILDLTVRQAMGHFERIPGIYRILRVLDQVGLGYIHLGQPAPTLS